MNVRGLHGVPKELLIKPTVKESQDGRASAKKLGLLDKDAAERPRVDPLGDPSQALSNVVRYAREQAFIKVRRATDRHYRKLLAAGRLFEARFEAGAPLGLRLHVASYSRESSVREVLEVEETVDDCPFWPDKIRPSDELVAVNGRLVVEASRESFPAIVQEIKSAPRPLVLTFAAGLQRAAAFARQQQARAEGRDGRPPEPTDVEDAADARDAYEEEEEERDRARKLEEARQAGIRDGEREVARLLEQEACPCFHYHLGLAARKCSECEPVDAHKLLAQHEIPGFKRRGLRPADCDLSPGQLVRIRNDVPQPRLGWYGGYQRAREIHNGALPVDHASVGVVVDVDRVGYDFGAVVTVCFDWVVRGFKVDADDLEAVDDGKHGAKAYDGRYDAEAASLAAFEKERARRVSTMSNFNRAYIFVNEDLDDHVRDVERPANARKSVAVMELERLDGETRGGSLHVAHRKHVEGGAKKGPVDIRYLHDRDYPCVAPVDDAPTESVTPEASEADPLDIVDAGALIDYVFGEVDDTIKFAKDELYADDDDEDDVRAPHITETLFPEDGLEKHVYELGPFPGEKIGADRYNSFNQPTKSHFGKAKVEPLKDVNHARFAPHITEELSYVCADPEYDWHRASTGWDGDLTEFLTVRVPFVEVDVAIPDLPDRIEIPELKLPDIPTFMLHMPKFKVPDLDIPDIHIPGVHIPGVPEFHDFDMLPEVEKPHLKIPKGPAIPHDRDFWDPTMVEVRMKRAHDSMRNLKFPRRKGAPPPPPTEDEPEMVNFAAPPVETVVEEDDAYEYRFDVNHPDPKTDDDAEALRRSVHAWDAPNASNFEDHHHRNVVPDGFAESKSDFGPSDLPDIASAVFGSQQTADAPAADHVGDLPDRGGRPQMKQSASSFNRPDLKHRDFKRAQKRATMLAFPEMEYHPEAKGTYGNVVAGADSYQ